MKMTKIESARIIVEQEGVCYDYNKKRLKCYECFNGFRKKKCSTLSDEETFKLAEAYIKRHEQKSKKRLIPKYTADVQPDTTGSELKKIVMKPANTDPTPLEIAKIIRDNEYVCLYVWDCTRQCPISNSKTGQLDCSINRKQLIDSYISSHEKPEPVYVTCINNRNTHTPLTIGKKYEVVGEGKGHYAIQDDIGTLCYMQKDRFDDGKEKASEPVGNTDKLVEPVIEPIKFDDPVPEYVYTVTDFGIFQFYVLRFEREWVKRKDNTESLIEKVYAHEGKKESERVRKEVSIDIKDCYSFKDAVAVAKKNWGLK